MTFTSPEATAEFSKFAGKLSASIKQKQYLVMDIPGDKSKYNVVKNYIA